MSGVFAFSTLLIIIGIVILAPILALLDIRNRNFPGAWRVYWVLIIVLVPFLGSLAYALLGHQTRED